MTSSTEQKPAAEMVLLDAICAAEKARVEWETACRRVLALASQKAPLFSKVLKEIQLEPTVAATWVCTSLVQLGCSPADAIAMGREDEVVTLLARALHGICV